jgi:hypothetical protein
MRPSSRTRVALLSCAVPVLLLGLAACGTTATTTTSSSSGSAAQASTSTDRWDEKTLVPAMKAALERQQSVHVSMRTVGGSRMPMEAEGDVALHGKDHPDVALTMDRTPMGGRAEVRVVGDVLYLSMPPMTPEGKFLELRPGDKSSALGQMMGQMREGHPEDPFAVFESGLREVTYVGQDTVQGGQLGHYRLTVDPGAMAEQHGMHHRSGMTFGGGTGYGGATPRAASFDVWLDDNALVHKVQIEKPRQGSLVVELSDWGTPVRVQAPPRQDVVEDDGRLPGMPGYSRS